MSGPIVKAFLESEFRKLLKHREFGFLQIMRHLDEFPKRIIIETGTARIQGNWEGDGQSTLVFNWLAGFTDYTPYSIDISATAIAIAKSQCKFVSFCEYDSVSFLSKLGHDFLKDVGLLYLDSMDWSPERDFESAFHHFCELASVWRLLPTGCLIVVDDCHGDFVGKHWMVSLFMNKVGAIRKFSGYQTGWVKT